MLKPDKIYTKIKKLGRKIFSGPTFGPQRQKVGESSAVKITKTLYHFGFKFFSVVLISNKNSLN